MVSRTARATAHAKRSTAEGGSVHAGVDGLRGLFRAEQRAEGDTAGERLGEGDDVRQKTVMLVGAQFAGTSHAGLNLVGDEQRAGGAGKVARSVEKFAGQRTNAALALNGLDEDRAEFAGEFCFQVIDVVEADEFDPRHHRIEGLAVLVFPGGGDRAHGAAVEAVFEREELCAERRALFALQLCPGTGELERGFVGFGAAVGEEGAIHPGGFGEAQREGGLALVVIEVGECE